MMASISQAVAERVATSLDNIEVTLRTGQQR